MFLWSSFSWWNLVEASSTKRRKINPIPTAFETIVWNLQTIFVCVVKDFGFECTHFLFVTTLRRITMFREGFLSFDFNINMMKISLDVYAVVVESIFFFFFEFDLFYPKKIHITWILDLLIEYFINIYIYSLSTWNLLIDSRNKIIYRKSLKNIKIQKKSNNIYKIIKFTEKLKILKKLQQSIYNY